MQNLYTMPKKFKVVKALIMNLNRPIRNLSIESNTVIKQNGWPLFTVAAGYCILKSLKIKPLLKTVGAVISGTVLFSGLQKNLFLVQATTKTQADKIKESDLLYDELKFEEIYNLLVVEKRSNNDEILWRLARAAYEKGRQTDNKEERKALYSEALQYLEEANEINSNNFAVHKWLAIIQDCYYSMEGMKARISHLYDMKTHMEKACALKPQDGTSWYVLGLWYFGIANISWYERKAASIFFATPPQASYEDALERFLEAERVEPNFYSKNHLMIGKCLYYIGRKAEAKEYLLKAKNCSGKTLDDQESRAEAEKWLSGL